jgi:hypothetical protein
MTTDEILRRLIEAYSVIDTVVSSPRPKAFGNNMPEVLRFPTEQDVWDAEMESIASDGGMTFRVLQDQRIRDLERVARSHYSSRQITQAEEAIRWPALVEDPVRREIADPQGQMRQPRRQMDKMADRPQQEKAPQICRAKTKFLPPDNPCSAGYQGQDRPRTTDRGGTVTIDGPDTLTEKTASDH